MPSSQINLCAFPCTAIKNGIDLDFSCRVLHLWVHFVLKTDKVQSLCSFLRYSSHTLGVVTWWQNMLIIIKIWVEAKWLEAEISEGHTSCLHQREASEAGRTFPFIHRLHKAWARCDEWCSEVRRFTVLFSCDVLSFGCGSTRTICSTLAAREAKWSLASTRGPVSRPRFLHLF